MVEALLALIPSLVEDSNKSQKQCQSSLPRRDVGKKMGVKVSMCANINEYKENKTTEASDN